MEVIIGGAYQGKREYVKSICKETNTWCDCKTTSKEDILKADIIYNYHIYVKNALKDGSYDEDFIDKIIENNKNLILISDEIGCGIVPMDEFDRNYREVYGKDMQIACKKADKVTRIFAGIPQIIKEVKN